MILIDLLLSGPHYACRVASTARDAFCDEPDTLSQSVPARTLQGTSAMMQAQLGARDTFIMGLLRDKVLVEEQNRVRTEGLRACLISWNWGFDQGAEPGACDEGRAVPRMYGACM